MNQECNHSPRCISYCRICGNSLPIFSEDQKGEKGTYLVRYENNSQHVIVGCTSVDEAINRSNVMLARSAGLCLKHLVRILSCEKMDTASALRRLTNKTHRT